MPSEVTKDGRNPLVAFRMPDPMHKAMCENAERTGRSYSEIMRTALAIHLDLDPWAADGPARSGAA